MTTPISLIRRRRRPAKSQGGLSLEAALVLAPCLLILTSLLFLLYAKLMTLSVRYALENLAEELAVIFPVADQALDSSSGKAKEILDRIIQGEEGSQLGQLAGDYASSLFLGPFMERRLDHWLERKTGGGGFPVLRHDRQLDLHWGSGGKSLRVKVYFTIPTLLGDYQEEFSALIPLWSQRLPGQGQGETKEEVEEREEDSIWSADNFSRGRYFREREGANLPLNYPVIAYYRQGTAKAIKSMDLTAPSYQDRDYTFMQIRGHLTRLADFHSHHSNSAALPDIRPGDITRKSLVLIVPENSPDKYDAAFWDRLQDMAFNQGIQLEVKRLGHSYRYEESPQNDSQN
ncbi:MAG: hypothetical protein Q4D97_00625 [Eubacteriales bacterium]|nr:hypothetical protein [Eubacteriales bacterium]